MCINVACRADVAVPQPLLNLLQAHAIGIEQTGAAMAQIVKADTLHLVCDQKIREMLAQEIGPNPFSHRVYIDIVKIIGAIAFAADLPILLLLLFHFIEHLQFTDFLLRILHFYLNIKLIRLHLISFDRILNQFNRFGDLRHQL